MNHLKEPEAVTPESVTEIENELSPAAPEENEPERAIRPMPPDNEVTVAVNPEGTVIPLCKVEGFVVTTPVAIT